MQLANRSAGTFCKIFRVVLGLYLLQHFIALLPWAGELFSSAGLLPVKSMSPLVRLFPNIFLLLDSPPFVYLLVGAAIAFSALFTLGKLDRLMALVIWYLWACFYGRNPMIGNPSLPFIGWLLLAYALTDVSRDEGLSNQREESSDKWKLPSDIVLAAWIVMSFAYAYGGYTKLASPSWIDGSALYRILENPLARDTAIRIFFLGLPALVLKLATWGTLALELLFAPLAVLRGLRPFVWFAMTALHVSLLLLINFADLTAGMLVLHLLTFDPRWAESLWRRFGGSPRADRPVQRLVSV